MEVAKIRKAKCLGLNLSTIPLPPTNFKFHYTYLLVIVDLRILFKISTKNKNGDTMDQYIKYIKEKLRDDSQIRYRDIVFGDNTILVIYDNSISDFKYISEFIILPIVNNINILTDIEKVKREIIIASSVGDIKSKDEAVEHILSGDAVIIFSSLNVAIYCEAKGFPKRAIESPPTEASIKGPREGFNEVLADNVAAIRRRIKHSDLKIEELVLGEKSNTSVAMIYIEKNAPAELVD